MHDEKLSVVKLWFKKANSDFKNIENNLKSNGLELYSVFPKMTLGIYKKIFLNI